MTKAAVDLVLRAAGDASISVGRSDLRSVFDVSAEVKGS
jgi:hypothetical protein